MHFRRTLGSCAFASVLAMLTVPLLGAVPASAPRSIRDIDVYGVRLGMTSDEIARALSPRFAHSSITIHRVPCLRDALAALGLRNPEAPARCIDAVRAQNGAELMWVQLVEDLDERRYGSTIVWGIHLGEPVPTQADGLAFREHALQRMALGPPALTGWREIWLTPSTNLFGISSHGDLVPAAYEKPNDTRVGWGQSPYTCGDATTEYIAALSWGQLELLAPASLCRSARIYRDRITQPTHRYDF